MPLISIISPVYQAEGCLEELYRRIVETVEKITKQFEIILIDDGSKDNSWNVICDLSRKDKRVSGYRLSRNFGQHYAIAAGIDYSTGDWVIIMDCDLQDRPEEIPGLFCKAQEKYDIVLAKRRMRKDSFLKWLSSWIFYKVLGYLTDTPQDNSIANFGIYKRKVINNIKSMKENLQYFPVMIRWLGFRTTTIEVEHSLRAVGKTTYNLKKLLRLAINTMLAFSYKPLRLTVKLGFIISVLSFFSAIYVFIQAIQKKISVMGWPSMIISIWFLSGIIIMIIGITGLYIGKIFDQVKNRPLYVIMETTNDPK